MVLDIVLRLNAFGLSYFKNVWNAFDAIVVILSFALGLMFAYLNSVRDEARSVIPHVCIIFTARYKCAVKTIHDACWV